jgi:hypothetical protein
MNIIEHAIHWYKGEIFEATIIGMFGLVFLVLSISLWKYGKTPNAQALIIPLALVGLLLVVAGVFTTLSNTKTLKAISTPKIVDQQSFVESEKQRVEDFQSLYTYTKIGAGVCFALAVVFFFATENRHWQAVAIALILIGVSGLTIDYFSKERANVYYHQLLKQTQ